MSVFLFTLIARLCFLFSFLIYDIQADQGLRSDLITRFSAVIVLKAVAKFFKQAL